jgi:hypothetical protein
MKVNRILTAWILLVSALAFGFSAQNQTGKVKEGPYVAGKSLKAPVVLCTGPWTVPNQSSDLEVRYQPLPSGPWFGKLRIEMKDGSVQEIDLATVKKMTVSDH